jgi:hypothetical protein
MAERGNRGHHVHMPDFWSHYDGTERIELGGGIWIDVKKSLTADEARAGENALVSTTFNEKKPDKPDIAIDPNAMLLEQVVASIVDWNIPPRDGKPFELDHDPVNERLTNRPSPRRQAILRLPSAIYDELAKVVGRLNAGLNSAQEASFQGDGDGGAAVEHDEAPDDGEVLAGTGVLGASGDSPGPEAAHATASA